MRNGWKFGLIGLMLAVAGFGLMRVEFDTDPLKVLPTKMPEVKGLQAFQEMFSRDEELVMMIGGSEEQAGTLLDRARGLAERLEKEGVAAGARWQPAWRGEPKALASLVAWLWLNGEPEEAQRLAADLSEENVTATMEAALERVATALDGGDLVLSAHDPFGFLGHSSMEAFFQASEHGGEGFESADGRAHLLFVDAPRKLEGYKECSAWLEEVKAVAVPWAKEQGVELSWTGDPAFEAEIGMAMERDMSGTVGVSSALIGLLFLLMQRRIGLLVGLGLVLGGVLVTAMGMAGWIYGELSIMAAGFAAILVGLAVDYGVLICQEAKVAGHDAAAIRRATGKSIIWAAATTTAVFLALNLSGLPGIAQLGTIVAIGVGAGALLMLTVYLPWVAKVGAGRAMIDHKRAVLPRGVAVWGLLGLLVAGGVGVLAVRGMPAVEFDRSLLRPKDSPAMAAFEAIQQKFPAWSTPALKLVVEGESDEVVRKRLEIAEHRLDALRARRPDLVLRVSLPTAWWPNPGHVEANRQVLRGMSDEKNRIVAAADEIGFSEKGTGLGRSVLEEMPAALALPAGELPHGEAVEELVRGRIAFRDERSPAKGGRVLGTVEVAEPDELSAEDFALLRSVSGEGIYLAGWAMLKPAVLPLVKKDLTDVFLPMAGLMVVMLALVFRKFSDVLFALGAMSLSGVLLLAAMKLTGLSWNFLNIAATPLLLGTGLDYAIHMLLALRRSEGDLRAVWNGTAKAVLFCGASTAIGFGSLAFASIDALASLGKVAVLGILISMAVSALLLPGVAVAMRRRESDR